MYVITLKLLVLFTFVHCIYDMIIIFLKSHHSFVPPVAKGNGYTNSSSLIQMFNYPYILILRESKRRKERGVHADRRN